MGVMRAGLMNERVAIWSPEKKTDGYGASKTTWKKTGLRYARVSYGSSGFGVQNGEAVYKSQVTFSLRYTDSVREYSRIEWDGRMYRITGIERYRRLGEMKVIGELIS